MLFSKLFSLASIAGLSAALPHVERQAASGGVLIVNNLDIPVYAWSVADTVSPMYILPAGGGSYTEQWRTNSNGGGISIKLATDPTQADVLQFEYTEAGDTIFWDMSAINLGLDSVFTDNGFFVAPSAADSTCPTVNCQAGDKACSEAYLQPYDDHATHGCPINTFLTLSLGN
ncbi:hypothetical protein HFD88_002232 [Aspergillus terreus]|uniref:Thaumatin-like protein n=1 Tax=Aspergillus terreus var. terreus TaxID=2081996 RepID=A0A7D7L7P1_ASPTE|nr:hypothetical protein HFD88_002232 [Aspergillus terreus]QMS79069.1 thaumatin-like protein [Aspergillus terreus var. terreus]